MKKIDIETQKEIDLHFGLRDFSKTLNYVEFSFHCYFYEIFNIENSYWKTELSGNEIFEIFNLLNIQVDLELVKAKFFDSSNHDVEVFHSFTDEQVFAYFDLQKDPTDQNDMFFLGISCNIEQDEIVCDKLRKIYQKLQTSSPFSYDRWNNILYTKVFHSYFYFYDNDYNDSKRKLTHHKNSL